MCYFYLLLIVVRDPMLLFLLRVVFVYITACIDIEFMCVKYC